MEAQQKQNRYTRCKICSSCTLVMVNAAHGLVQCGNCDFVFAGNSYSEPELKGLYATLYADGGVYNQYYSPAYKKLLSGKTPWIGFERRAVLRHILRQRVKVIGEIGASMGMTAQYLQKFNLEYHGFEFDERTAGIAQQFGFNVSCGDHSSLEGLRSRLDALVAFEVLEHVQDVKECLAEIRKCLRPSGLLGLSVPNYDKRLNDPRPGYLGQNKPPVHLNFWNIHSLRKTLKLSGFRPQLLRVRRRPDVNPRDIVGTLTSYLRACINSYHGPTIICVAQKSSRVD